MNPELIKLAAQIILEKEAGWRPYDMMKAISALSRYAVGASGQARVPGQIPPQTYDVLKRFAYRYGAKPGFLDKLVLKALSPSQNPGVTSANRSLIPNDWVLRFKKSFLNNPKSSLYRNQRVQSWLDAGF